MGSWHSPTPHPPSLRGGGGEREREEGKREGERKSGEVTIHSNCLRIPPPPQLTSCGFGVLTVNEKH